MTSANYVLFVSPCIMICTGFINIVRTYWHTFIFRDVYLTRINITRLVYNYRMEIILTYVH